jgi:glycosyltransferase involved in cell wall biosynthesis
VHTHASKAGAIGRLAAYHCKVPVIVHTFHGHVFKGYFSDFKTSVFKNIERYLSRKSSAIVAISAIQKKELSKEHKVCNETKTHIIKLGFDLNRFKENKEEKRNFFRRKYSLENDVLAIGIIGRLAPIKNHYLFIDAVEHVLKNTTTKIKAFIIGGGETENDLIAYLDSKSLSHSKNPLSESLFIFTGWIKEVDVALAGLDIVCLTSKNEGTPVSIIEAQAAGKFVVTTNVGGIKDILHSECGFLSDLGEDNTYKNNLLNAVTNFTTISKNANAASESVLKEFSFTRLCHEMDILYKSILKN